MTLILRGGNLKVTVKTQFPAFKGSVKLGTVDIQEVCSHHSGEKRGKTHMLQFWGLLVCFTSQRLVIK